MIDPNTTAERYLALWNDADDASRRNRLTTSWTVDARYSDPLMTGNDREEIASMIAGARQQFPGHVFTLRGTPDGYGCFARFSWTLATAEGASVISGTDIARLDEAGQIAEVIGFLDGGAA